MTTYRFQEVSRTARRTIRCAKCGKRRTRQRTFTNTINPFNKNADGIPKDWSEVARDVAAEAAAWQPTVCASCEAVPT